MNPLPNTMTVAEFQTRANKTYTVDQAAADMKSIESLTQKRDELSAQLATLEATLAVMKDMVDKLEKQKMDIDALMSTKASTLPEMTMDQ